jgi:hypothetical protein
MTENNKYYQELIYQYLDGDADDAESAKLFKALGSDAELQNEFAQAIELNKALSDDKEQLVPSAQLTDSLFKRAGFKSDFIPPTPQNSSRLVDIARYAFLKLGAGLVLSSLAFTAYNLIDRNAVGIQAPNANISKSSSMAKNYPMPSVSEATDKAIKNSAGASPRFNKMLADNYSSIQTNKSKRIANKMKSSDAEEVVATVNDATNNDTKINKTILGEINNNAENKFESISLSHVKNVNYLMDNMDNNYSAAPNNYIFSDELSLPEELNIKMTLGGVSSLEYYPSRDIKKGGESMTENFTLSLLYQFSENNSFGIIGGKEALQMYDVDQIGDYFKFKRQSSVTWVGLNYKYNVGEIESIFGANPYAEISAGGTKYGPITKLGFGFNLPLMNKINMGLGYEFTSLMYTEMSSYKFTHKSGIVYKITYSF